MVLVYLKNLVFPSSSSRSTLRPSPTPSTRTSHDLEAADLPNLNFSHSQREHLLSSTDLDSFSASSSMSGDTVIDQIAPRSFHIDPRVISDATIGLSDGLTVPFALTAGLSALGDTRIVIFGGLAELTAGAISMGMGGYLAATSESEAYTTTFQATRHLCKTSPSTAATIVRTTLSPFFPASSSQTENSPLETVTSHLLSDPTTLTAFLMRFHHSLNPPEDTRSAYMSALTIAFSYFTGGFLPLLPYFFANEIGTAFWYSVGVMVVALFAFGSGKTWVTACSGLDGEGDGAECARLEEKEKVGRRRRTERKLELEGLCKCVKGGLEMVVLGGVAATASVGLVKAFG